MSEEKQIKKCAAEVRIKTKSNAQTTKKPYMIRKNGEYMEPLEFASKSFVLHCHAAMQTLPYNRNVINTEKNVRSLSNTSYGHNKTRL